MPDPFWSKMKNVQTIHRRLYDSGKGWIIGRFILLLTHTGRKSGSRYVTPLQYEKIAGNYCIAAGRGVKADWFRNIQADPHVHIRVGRLAFDCVAEPVTDAERVADFLEYRLQRHPLMIGLILKLAHKLPMHPSRAQFVELGAATPLVILHPPKEMVAS